MIQSQSLSLIAGRHCIHHLKDPSCNLDTAHRINILFGNDLSALCVGDQFIQLIFYVGHGIIDLLQQVGCGTLLYFSAALFQKQCHPRFQFPLRHCRHLNSKTVFIDIFVQLISFVNFFLNKYHHRGIRHGRQIVCQFRSILKPTAVFYNDDTMIAEKRKGIGCFPQRRKINIFPLKIGIVHLISIAQYCLFQSVTIQSFQIIFLSIQKIYRMKCLVVQIFLQLFHIYDLIPSMVSTVHLTSYMPETSPPGLPALQNPAPSMSAPRPSMSLSYPSHWHYFPYDQYGSPCLQAHQSSLRS